MNMINPYNVECDLAWLANDCHADKLSPIVNGLTKEHPTIQQSFTGHFILNYIRIMAKKYMTNSYDARNKMACRICSKMWNQIKDEVSNGQTNPEWISLPLI